MKRNAIFLLFLYVVIHLGAQDIRPLPSDSAYGVVHISVCNLREEGRFMSGMSTQALLGTPVRVLRYNGWYEIQTPDGYIGWVHRLTITPLSKECYEAWNRAPKVVVTAITAMAYERPSHRSQPVSDLVAGNRLKWEGSTLHYYKVSYPDGRCAYLPRSAARPEARWRSSLRQDAESILHTARSLCGIPYLWGGMSTKGADCSGFVRTVLFLHDIVIPRDASQQAAGVEHLPVLPDCSNLRPADLLFFGHPATADSPERVSHVGFYLGGQRFIHSLGDVHVNSLCPTDPDYDAFNAGRLLFAVRFLPYINMKKGWTTTDHNEFYLPLPSY